jgi:hypothetical protein
MINIAEVMEQYAKEIEGGMTLRDYFAGLAMQRFMMDETISMSEIAEDAYLMADFMLKARETK